MISMFAQSVSATPDGTDNFLLFGFLFLGAAVILLFLELFVPSGGLIGALAGIAGIASIICFFRYDTTWGLVAAGSYVVLGPIAGVFVFRWWLNSPLARNIILGGPDLPNAEGDTSAMSAEHARQERSAQLRQLIGAHGVTVTPLRPVGTVKINGQRIDAMAEGTVIDAGTPVIVTDVYDNQIKVRPV